MRGQKILRAGIERGLAGLHRGVAFHRGEEARRAIGVETGAGGDADADAVGLEFLRAREARHRQFGFRQRQRRQIGIVAHVGDDAGHHRRLPRLVFADRGVFCDDMRHLVAQHRGQFGGVAGKRDQAARHIELAGRQREGVDRAGIEDGHPVGLLGSVGGRDQPVDRLADQGGKFRIFIGAAVGGQNALMLALAGRRLRDRCGSASAPAPARRSVSSFPRFPQAESASAAHSSAGAARRRQPVFPSRGSARCVKISLWTHDSSGIVDLIRFAFDPTENRCPVSKSNARSRPAPQLCPTAKQFNPWSSPRRDNATDTNSFIFERLRPKAGVLERRHDAPWNSRRKVPCPVSPEVQVGDRPCLPDRPDCALDHRKVPNRGQNIARTFRVFYGRWLRPNAQFGIARHALGSSQGGSAIFVCDINGCERLATAQQFALQ